MEKILRFCELISLVIVYYERILMYLVDDKLLG